MPSGKSKSKENTWTEKDLTDAIQGERPRRLTDDRPEKRRSRDLAQNDRDRERERRRHKSDRHQEEDFVDGEESHSRRTKDDRERKHKDRNKERLKDNDRDSGDRKRERRRKETYEEEEHEDDRRRHREKEEGSRSKEKRHKDDQDEPSRERKNRDERKRNKERNEEEDDRDKEERSKEKSRKDRRESSNDRNDRNEKKKDKERREARRRDDEENYESERRRDKDDRRREREREHRSKEKRSEKDEGGKDNNKRERRRDKETDGRSKDSRRDKNENRKERHRDRSPDEDIRKDKKKDRRRHEEDEDDEKERRRRRRKEREEVKENKDDESDDRDRRRKDKKRSEEDIDDKKKRREEKERRKTKERDQEYYESERQRKERKDSVHAVDKNESAEKRQSNDRTLSTTNEVEVAEEIQNEDDYDDYEDDFEDYEDDFEDDGEDDVDGEENGNEQGKGKLLEIFEAINAENNDIRRSPYQQTIEQDSKKETEKPVRKSEPHGRINFFAAKQKHVTEFVASKTRKRAQELKNLIELDVASYDIFDLPPLNEYELYIKSYGQSDSKQAYVQCHDDIIEKEMQTEVIEMSTKWTQYPPDDFKGCGEGDECQTNKNHDEDMFSPHSVDSVRLTNFLQQAGQVCLILLEERNSARKDLMFKERNDIDISNGFIQLASKLPFLEGRRVMDMKFNSVQTHLLLTAHNCSNIEDNAEDKRLYLRGQGVVCYWNINEPSQPQKILYCESSPKSCCFSPVKPSLVFAGLEDGSVVVWDIRESSSLHSTINNKDNQWVIRRPTFSTAGVLFNENHLTPVQNILPVALPIDSAQALSRSTALQDEPGGMAFQLASLDESGLVNIWVVIELDKPDDAGSENDLGLAPGGRVKLIKSTSIQVESPHREIFVGSTVQTSVMQFSTLDPNLFYVGTDRGWVIHCTRYGGKIHPKVYRPETESFVSISAIDVSPWNIPVMLVGCLDGTLRLHDLRKEYAIRSWPESTQGSAIVQLMWSKCRPSLFFILDAKSNLYIWDLLQNDGHPVATESFKRGKLLHFSMSNDYESLGIGLPGRKSELVLNYESGIIELHRLKESLTSFKADELDRFTSLVDSKL